MFGRVSIRITARIPVILTEFFPWVSSVPTGEEMKQVHRWEVKKVNRQEVKKIIHALVAMEGLR